MENGGLRFNFYNQITQFMQKKIVFYRYTWCNWKRNETYINNTTVDPISLHKILNRIRKEKIENVILEASSHGLHQSRLDGVKFDIRMYKSYKRSS